MGIIRRVVAVGAVAGLAVVVGCGSSSGSSSTTTGAATATGGAQTMQTATQSGTSTTATGTTTGPAANGVQNLHVTNALRAELLKVGAASHNLPATDYTGLAPGRTYYAYDPATSTYWAGAALVPSSSSTPAQVSVQDDGAYLLYERPSGGSWSVYAVGMTLEVGSKCPVAVPAAVLSVWGWAPGTCRPAD